MFDDLINYYRTSHRTGHTTLLVESVVAFLRREPFRKLIVFVADGHDIGLLRQAIAAAYAAKDSSRHAGDFNAARVRIVPIRDARLAQGLRCPALIDNHAMEVLLTDFDVELGCRRARIDALAEELGSEKRKSAALSERVENLEGWLDQKREAVRAAEAHAKDLEARLEDIEARAVGLDVLRNQLAVETDAKLAAQARIADLERRLADEAEDKLRLARRVKDAEDRAVALAAAQAFTLAITDKSLDEIRARHASDSREILKDFAALEHRAASAEEHAKAASTLPADFTIDGKSVADVLAGDAAAGHPAQDVLHAIARELGWRADWSTGSPITLQAVVDEIRKRRAACEQAGLRTIEADAKRLVAEEQRLDSDMLLVSMLGDFKPDATAPSAAELQALLDRISAVACATRAQRLDENRTLASRLSTALSVADGLRRRVADLEKQLAAEQDARLVAEEHAADLEGQLDEIGERDSDIADKEGL